MWVALGRIHRIAEKLRSRQWITAAQLAAEEEVSTKTIYRTIDFLRDQLLWNIEGGAPGMKLVKRRKPYLRPNEKAER